MAKLEKLEVSFISLVEKPANRKDIVLKASDKYNFQHLIKITKSEERGEEGLIYGEVYRANEKDSHGDWADAETIKKAAHEFLQKGRMLNVDENHDGTPSGASVVESYLEDNAWKVVIKTEKDSELFKKVKKGDYKGLSLFGLAVKKDEEPPASAEKKDELKEVVQKLQDQISELTAVVKGIPKTRQLKFDSAGKITNSESDQDEVFGEFCVLELD